MASQAKTLAIATAEAEQNSVRAYTLTNAVAQNQGTALTLTFPFDAPSKFWIRQIDVRQSTASASAMAQTTHQLSELSVSKSGDTLYRCSLRMGIFDTASVRDLVHTMPQTPFPIPLLITNQHQVSIDLPAIDAGGSPAGVFEINLDLVVDTW